MAGRADSRGGGDGSGDSAMTMLQRAPEARPKATGPRRIAVVPVFNEEPTVVGVLEELLTLVDEIVVVDDGSTDRSREVILDWSLGRQHVHTILFNQNQGLSSAYFAAFREIGARLHAGELAGDDLVITVDADGQHDPTDLDRLAARVTEDGYDAAIARRDMSGYSFVKRAGNGLLSVWASVWAGTRLYDVESGFRVFRAGPLVEALRYYHGFRYSETVEVAVVLPRLGYRIANDVSVPVPVQRSRTRISDGIIDALAMIGAWWRVVAGRHKPADMPAWSMYVVPVLALLALLFGAGDILAHRLFLASDSMHNYAHIWYLSDQIFHHATIPIHVSLLDSGKAATFPYAIGPYLAGALIYPIFGNWAVSLLMAIAVVGTVWAAGVVRPAMRDPWLIALFVLNPFFIDAAFSFQFASLWSALFFFLFVRAFERQQAVPAALLLWLCVSSQPVMGSLAAGVYGLAILALHRERFGRLLMIGAPVGLALIPIYWMTLMTPSLSDNTAAFVRSTAGSIAARGTFFAAPFALSAAAPLLRRYYRPALSFGVVSAVVGVLFMGGIIRFYRSPSGYYGVLHDSSDVYAQYFASPAFQAGATYRVLEPSEREDGMYRFIQHRAVLSNEFFTESTMFRNWSTDQYGCYAAYKGIDYVVVERAWEERSHLNEGHLLQSLVSSGSASVSYTDPGGRFVVYNIQPFVSVRQKPAALSGCSL
ncbi:MAG TPA: glycosyltransferase family 2 protein [Dehalococcoidia bacterium]